MAPLPTRDIIGVEILKAGGPFHGVKGPKGGTFITEADLDAAVDAHQALAGAVASPVKLGHSKLEETVSVLQGVGAPALGWLANFRRKGKSLLVDLQKVPAAVADLIETGAWRKVSSEFIRNFEGPGGKTYPFFVSGLALLGGRLPAITDISDVVALYEGALEGADAGAQGVLVDLALNPGGDDGSAGSRSTEDTQGGDDMPEALSPELREALGVEKDADQAAVLAKVRELKESAKTVDDRTGELTTATERVTALEAEIKTLKAAKAEEGKGDEGADARIAKLETAVTAAVESFTTKLTELASKAEQGEKAAVALAKAERESLIDGAVKDGRLTPAQRADWLKLAEGDLEQAKTLLDALQPVADFDEEIGHDDRPESEVEAEEAEADELAHAAAGLPYNPKGGE